MTVAEILTDHFVRDLHRRPYADVWEWGGRFRLLQTNIGITPEQIAVQLRSEMDNLRYRWAEVHDLDPKTLALLAQVAVVRIHPFVDGNGRATRLLADLALAAATTGEPQRFDWNIDRRAYIAAVVHYDNGRDLTPLAELVQIVPAQPSVPASSARWPQRVCGPRPWATGGCRCSGSSWPSSGRVPTGR